MELRQILNLTPTDVFVFGSDGNPLYANRVALEYFGVDIVASFAMSTMSRTSRDPSDRAQTTDGRNRADYGL